jgi:hypothetical protein
MLSCGVAAASHLLLAIFHEANEGLEFLWIILTLAQSFAGSGTLLLTTSGYSTLSRQGPSKQQTRDVVGLAVFCGIGDLVVVGGGGGSGGSSGSGNSVGPSLEGVLVQAVFRTTLLVFAGISASRIQRQVAMVRSAIEQVIITDPSTTLTNSNNNHGNSNQTHLDTIRQQCTLMAFNVALIASLQVYLVVAWVGAVWWPVARRLLPVTCIQVPIMLLYSYIVVMIRRDLL